MNCNFEQVKQGYLLFGISKNASLYQYWLG
jgi:hypothetical protein